MTCAFAGCALLALSFCVGRVLGEGPSQLDAADLQRQVDSITQHVDQLAPHGALLDSLHFEWFDRPYARATLATLVKTSAVLQREVRLRNAGNGAIPAATLKAMLQWATDALDRVLADEPDPRFRPHRLRFTASEIASGQTPPLFAFLDRTTATRLHPAFGDLDLFAAAGQRVYVPAAAELADAGNFQTLVRRAEFLGITVVNVLPTPTTSNSVAAPTATAAGLLPVQPLTITDLLAPETTSSMLEAYRSAALPPSGKGQSEGIGRETLSPFGGRGPGDGNWGKTPSLPALMESDADEAWPSRISRRALIRGATSHLRCAVYGWNADRPAADTADCGWLAAAMWVDALEGVSLAIAGGWRDLRDGSDSASPSVFTRPDELESLARTALDILRFADYIRPFEKARPIAIVVSMEAVDSIDHNKWAGWIEPFLAALFERQIAFDIVSDASDRDSLGSRYSVVFPLKHEDAGDWSTTIVRLERELTALESFTHRQTVRTLDGAFPRNLYVREDGPSAGAATLAVVNLSGSPQELKLNSGASTRLRDVISGSLTVGRDGRFTIDPWQTCIFTAR